MPRFTKLLDEESKAARPVRATLCLIAFEPSEQIRVIHAGSIPKGVSRFLCSDVPFQNVPRVTAHLVGYAGSVEIVSVSATQVILRPGAAVFEGSPATFAPTIHWQAMGT